MTSVGVDAVHRGTHPGEQPTENEPWPWAISVAASAVLLYVVAAGDHGRQVFGVNALHFGFIVVSVAVSASNLLLRSAMRAAEHSLVAIITLTVALPAGRLPHDSLTLEVDVAALALIGFSGLVRRSSERAPYGWILLSLMFSDLLVSTGLSPDSGALKAFALTLIPTFAAFLLTARLGGHQLRRVAAVIVSLGVVNAVLAVAEPFAFPGHLWAPAQIDPQTGSVEPLYNSILRHGLERSQGTLGHPLPLGLLLVLGIAYLVRLLRVGLRHRIWLIAVLFVGLVFAGDRNSLSVALIIVFFYSARRLYAVRAVYGVLMLIFGVVLAFLTNVVNTTQVSNVIASGSFTHRLGAYPSVGKLLFLQPVQRSLAGNGFGSTTRIFRAGLLQTDNKLFAVDNEFVSLLSQGGLVCLLLFLFLTTIVLVRRGSELWPPVLAVVITLLVFDTFQWPSISVLTMIVYGAALRRPQPADQTATAAEHHDTAV